MRILDSELIRQPLHPPVHQLVIHYLMQVQLQDMMERAHLLWSQGACMQLVSLSSFGPGLSILALAMLISLEGT